VSARRILAKVEPRLMHRAAGAGRVFTGERREPRFAPGARGGNATTRSTAARIAAAAAGPARAAAA